MRHTREKLQKRKTNFKHSSECECELMRFFFSNATEIEKKIDEKANVFYFFVKDIREFSFAETVVNSFWFWIIFHLSDEHKKSGTRKHRKYEASFYVSLKSMCANKKGLKQNDVASFRWETALVVNVCECVCSVWDDDESWRQNEIGLWKVKNRINSLSMRRMNERARTDTNEDKTNGKIHVRYTSRNIYYFKRHWNWWNTRAHTFIRTPIFLMSPNNSSRSKSVFREFFFFVFHFQF